MIVPVKRKRIYEDISNQIIEQIEEGVWKEGERIRGELELADLFQVSRGSIREVIKSLQMMGILESKSGQGTFVRKNALQKIRDSRFIHMINDEQYRDQVLECRYLIEPQAAFIAAQICTDADIKYLRDSYDQMMKACREGNIHAMNEWGMKFHSHIVSMVKNDVLMSIYQSMEHQALEDREEFMEGKDNQLLLKYHEDHLKLIEAFEAHDSERARKISEIHIGRKLRWKKEGEPI